MENIKIRITRLVLGSLLALGLASKITSQEIPTVYAAPTDETNDDLIKFTEDGKKLQFINVRIGDADPLFEKNLFGYLYVYNNFVYLEDKTNSCVSNLSELDREYGCQIVYTDAKNVMPTKLKENQGITKEQATEISNRFQVTTVKHSIDSGFGISYFYTKTFSAPGFDNENLHTSVSNHDIFGADYDMIFGSLYDKYLLPKEKSENPLELGQEENTLHAYYGTASQTEPSGFKDESGILLKYYAYNKEGEKVASLGTWKEIDEFLETHQYELNDYYWKAAFYAGNNVDEMLDYLQNNQEVPVENISYFIDYKLPSRK